MNATIGIVGTLGVLDAVYLTSRQVYHDNLFQSIQKSPLKIRYIPAALVYVTLAFAVFYYAVKDAKSMNDAIFRGALIGFLMYVFYDLTNYATLTNYTLPMLITDSVWGSILSASAAAVGYYVKSL